MFCEAKYREGPESHSSPSPWLTQAGAVALSPDQESPTDRTRSRR